MSNDLRSLCSFPWDVVSRPAQCSHKLSCETLSAAGGLFVCAVHFDSSRAYWRCGNRFWARAPRRVGTDSALARRLAIAHLMLIAQRRRPWPKCALPPRVAIGVSGSGSRARQAVAVRRRPATCGALELRPSTARTISRRASSRA